MKLLRLRGEQEANRQDAKNAKEMNEKHKSLRAFDYEPNL